MLGYLLPEEGSILQSTDAPHLQPCPMSSPDQMEFWPKGFYELPWRRHLWGRIAVCFFQDCYTSCAVCGFLLYTEVKGTVLPSFCQQQIQSTLYRCFTQNKAYMPFKILLIPIYRAQLWHLWTALHWSKVFVYVHAEPLSPKRVLGEGLFPRRFNRPAQPTLTS